MRSLRSRAVRSRLTVLVLLAAAVLTACLPAGVQRALPAGKPVPVPANIPQAFDSCGLPGVDTMAQWWNSSPYTVVGVYVGGIDQGCPQPNLTRSWVATVVAQGWRIIPLWVGPQAPCVTFTHKLPTGVAAAGVGIAEADAAVAAMQSLGLSAWLTPVYYDLEAYKPRATDGSCLVTNTQRQAIMTSTVQSLMSGWTYELNRRGYQAGLYSSLCSGITDESTVPKAPQFGVYPPDAVFIASWSNVPNLFGFSAVPTTPPTPPCPPLPDTVWLNHKRIHQYSGGHNETWPPSSSIFGSSTGATVNVDSSVVDGPLAPP